MTDRATKKQIRYILALNHHLGGGPARYANQLAVDLPLRLRAIDLHTATRRQASEIIQRLLEAQQSDRTATSPSISANATPTSDASILPNPSRTRNYEPSDP